jgi:hypothetical protein
MARAGPPSQQETARPCGRAVRGHGLRALLRDAQVRLRRADLNVVTIWVDDVSRKNLSDELAQVCSSEEVGSPPVLIWMV